MYTLQDKGQRSAPISSWLQRNTLYLGKYCSTTNKVNRCAQRTIAATSWQFMQNIVLLDRYWIDQHFGDGLGPIADAIDCWGRNICTNLINVFNQNYGYIVYFIAKDEDLFNLMEEYSKPTGCASFLLALSMKNPPKVTSRLVRCSPRGTAVSTYNKNTMVTNRFNVLQRNNVRINISGRMMWLHQNENILQIY